MKEQTSESLDVNLIAGFVGLKFIPMPIVVGTNNINPKLLLNDFDFEHRGAFFSKKDFYGNVKNVDVFFARKTTNVIITKDNSIFTFVGNTNSNSELYKCLVFLEKKGCEMSEKANDFLKNFIQ